MKKKGPIQPALSKNVHEREEVGKALQNRIVRERAEKKKRR